MNKYLIGVVLLLVGICAFAASASGLCEDEMVLSARLLSRRCSTSVDLRMVIPVMGESDSALTGIDYSARGWRLEVPVDDSTRTAEITAVPGTLVGRVFTPSGASATILEARQGEGSWTWELSSAPEKKVYRLTHVAKISDAIDEPATCFGYFDFTRYGEYASQAQVEEAVLDPKTEPVVTTQDAVNPWQPVRVGIAGIGIATDANLADGVLTTTAFAFQGKGTFSCEYKLGDGTLVATIDGEPLALSAAADWQALSIPIDAVGVHTVSFAYTSAGNGGTVALRKVCWEVPASMSLISRSRTDVRVDLREGLVRSPERMEHVLPFAYSSTNWIGDVQETAARVTITELTGTDADVRTWSEKGATRVLYNAPGEGAVKWHPKKGVWKATFDILGTSHSEEVWFDLRNAIAPGFLLMVF